MAIPLLIRCECGHTTETTHGQQVTCVCGRVYNTSQIDRGEYLDMHRMANRQRLYVRIGLVVATAIGILSWVSFGLKGPALAVPLAALIWWRVVQPRFQRGQAELLRSQPVVQLESSDRA
jgi:hypothetical protein